jgi:hypothetical protein
MALTVEQNPGSAGAELLETVGKEHSVVGEVVRTLGSALNVGNGSVFAPAFSNRERNSAAGTFS